MNKIKKTKKLGKFVRKVDADELKKVSGGVNADEQDRNEVLGRRIRRPGGPFPGGTLPGGTLPG